MKDKPKDLVKPTKCPVTKKMDDFRDVLAGGDKNKIEAFTKDIMEFARSISIPELDKLCSMGLAMTSEATGNAAVDRELECLRSDINAVANKYAGVFQYFHTVFPPSKKVEDYMKDFHKAFDSPNVEKGGKDSVRNITMAGFNSLLFDYGMAAVPDVVRMGRRANADIQRLVNSNLRVIWQDTCYEVSVDMAPHPVFEAMNLSVLKHVMLPMGLDLPDAIMEAKNLDMTEYMVKDVQRLTESYTGEILTKKLQSYQERAMDVQCAHNIFMNMFQEAAYSVESYEYIKDQFESIGERCEREEQFLRLAEAAYRQTGKRPQYIDNTYDFGEVEDAPKKKDDEWINAPKDDLPLDIPDKGDKKKDLDPDDDGKKGATNNSRSGNVYNITYTNSFNKKSHQKNTTGSYNNSRLNSDNISGEGSGKGSEEEVDWDARRKMQLRLVKTYEKYPLPQDPPDDRTEKYLDSILWTTVNRRAAKPWDIMLDTHKDRPKKDISYRKYLAKKIIDLADDRDIDYDGKIIVAGDAVDGIFEIEINRKNDPSVIEALRKCANAVIESELQEIKPKKQTKSKILNEALELFDDMQLFQERIAGGDPEKDRPILQRARNKITDFNVKAQDGLRVTDDTLRDSKGVLDAAAQTPVQLVRVVKNFISDMSNRREQNIKEDLLKDKKTKRFILDAMSSLIKTALPWVIAGPLWGTLINMVAIPIRSIKGAHDFVRGGPHYKLMIEIREEMRTEIAVVEDLIHKAEVAGNVREKHALMRKKNRMIQEYLKIAGKIHWDPTFKNIERAKISD